MENTVELYIAAIPEGAMGTVCAPARQAQLEATEKESLRRQRYFVWKLLEHALEKSFGMKPENVAFSMDEKGKWHCKECFFSLSHCREAVAVAVSAKPVGVDIELADRQVAPALSKKVLTEAELALYEQVPEEEKKRFLLEVWCGKESLFKAAGGAVFTARKWDTTQGVRTGVTDVSGRAVCYAVAAEDPNSLGIFSVSL